MWASLRQIFNYLSSLPSCRAILLSGAGDRAFTAGLDLQAALSSGPLAPTPANEPQLDPARKAVAIRRHILDFQDCITAVEKCEKRTSSPPPVLSPSKHLPSLPFATSPLYLARANTSAVFQR